jgi:hypothetical protein
VADVPQTRGTGYPEELEELPEDAIVMLKSSPYASAPFNSAPTNPRIPALAPAVEDDIVELGQDVIVGEERGAHLPQPRTAVQQSNASVVINARSPSDSLFPQGEKTVVVRDRRKLEQYAAAVQGRNQHEQQKLRRRERVMFFSAGIVAALLGTGVVAWLSAGTDQAGESPPAEVRTIEGRAADVEATTVAPAERATQKRDTPTVSIDQLPVADKH